MSKPSWYRRRSLIVTAIILAQVIFLIGITVSHYAIGWYGKEIRLQTVPIDPRDLMYGDYVVLNYDINEIDKSLWKGEINGYELNNNLYVVLKPDNQSKNGTYEAVGLYDREPAKQADEVILKARYEYSSDSTIRVKYGLETYYVPENTGKKLEEQIGKMVTIVKVAPWGRAVIDEIELK